MKAKGTILDRFEKAVMCVNCPHSPCIYADLHVETEQDTCAVTLIVEGKSIGYSRYFDRATLLKAEKGIGLEAFAEEQLKIAAVGIMHIREKNPFKDKEEWLKDAGTYVATYEYGG